LNQSRHAFAQAVSGFEFQLLSSALRLDGESNTAIVIRRDNQDFNQAKRLKDRT
jgi:hypothetical protein